MHWYLDVLKQYAVFDGRTNRKPFWMFWLFQFIAYCILYVLEGMLGLRATTEIGGTAGGYGYLTLIYALATLLPVIGLHIRRLHDTGKSGWWLLISFIPIVGAIILLVFYLMDSEPGSNQYGGNPKGE